MAKPQSESRGGLVVVQEIYGINAHIQTVCDRYAAEGYFVIAPALFDRYEKNVKLTYEGEDQKKAFELYGKLQPETALLDVAAGFAHLKQGMARIAVLGLVSRPCSSRM